MAISTIEQTTAVGASAVQVIAHAKVNLRLRVLARETTGFHQLETLFLRLGLGDTVVVRRTAGETSLDIGGDADLSEIGPLDKNLALRAAAAYVAAGGERFNVAIEIEKRIPIGGGMGGGSADAAAVLRALNVLSRTPLPDAQLLAIAASLGSDVPFLASNAAFALAWGRGERMLALEPPVTRGVLLTLPSFGVNTAEAFGWLASERVSANAKTAADATVLDLASLSDWQGIGAIAMNDLEPIVNARHPGIGAVLSALRASEDVELAFMTGSGSTLVAIAKPGCSVERVLPPQTMIRLREMTTQTLTQVEPPAVID